MELNHENPDSPDHAIGKSLARPPDCQPGSFNPQLGATGTGVYSACCRIEIQGIMIIVIVIVVVIILLLLLPLN